jgi:hypothetical protein
LTTFLKKKYFLELIYWRATLRMHYEKGNPVISKLSSFKRTYLVLVGSLAVLCFGSMPASAHDLIPVEPAPLPPAVFAWAYNATAKSVDIDVSVDGKIESGLYVEIGRTPKLGHRKDVPGPYRHEFFQDEDGTTYEWSDATLQLNHLKPAQAYYYRGCLENVGCTSTDVFYTSPD